MSKGIAPETPATLTECRRCHDQGTCEPQEQHEADHQTGAPKARQQRAGGSRLKQNHNLLHPLGESSEP